MLSLLAIAATHNAFLDRESEKASPSSGSGSNSGLQLTESSSQQQPLEPYQKEIPLSTSIGFYLEQESAKRKTITMAGTIFPDYKSAEAKFHEGDKAALYLGVTCGGQMSLSFLKGRGTIEQHVFDDAKVCKVLTDSVSGLTALKTILKKSPKVTKITIQNALDSAFLEMNQFPNLHELTVINSTLNESLKKWSELNLDTARWKHLSDESLAHFESCPKLTTLTLIDVKDITNKALWALQQKKMDLSIKQEFTPPALAKKLPTMYSRASLYFETYSVQIENGHAFSQFIFSQTEHEGKGLLQNKNFKYGYMHVQVRSSEISQTFDLVKAGKFPDISQIRKFTHQPQELNQDSKFVQELIEKLKPCKNLKEIVLFNVTKKVLLCLQVLTQVETIVVNNTDFEEAKKLLFARSYTPKDAENQLEEQLAPPDDETILDFKAKELPKLNKMVMIGCPKVTEAVSEYVNATQGFRLYFKEEADSEQTNNKEKQVVVVD